MVSIVPQGAVDHFAKRHTRSQRRVSLAADSLVESRARKRRQMRQELLVRGGELIASSLPSLLGEISGRWPVPSDGSRGLASSKALRDLSRPSADVENDLPDGVSAFDRMGKGGVDGYALEGVLERRPVPGVAAQGSPEKPGRLLDFFHAV